MKIIGNMNLLFVIDEDVSYVSISSDNFSVDKIILESRKWVFEKNYKIEF